MTEILIIYHIETSPLICPADQWTGLYMIGTSIMKELNGISCCYPDYTTIPIKTSGTYLCFSIDFNPQKWNGARLLSSEVASRVAEQPEY